MSLILKAPSSSGTEYTLPMPTWGYSVTASLALTIERTKNGMPRIWDNGTANDSRTLECTWFLNLADTESLVNICKDAGKGRDANVDIILSSGSGFYPFGPDKGDAGTFRARIISADPQPSIGHPQDHFNTTVRFVFNGTYPAYALPSQITEGSLSIGSATGLRYPENMHTQRALYNAISTLTQDGTPYTLDKATGDQYECTLDLVLQQPNMAALMAQMTVTTRGAAVNVVPPANAYLFGRENASTATYSCKPLQAEYTVTHNAYNSFSTSLSFFRISQS